MSEKEYSEQPIKHQTETLRAGLVFKHENMVFAFITLPTPGLITELHGITQNESILIEKSVVSIDGLKHCDIFGPNTKFKSGSYYIGAVLQSNEEADKITDIELKLTLEPISIFMLSQMIFGLYRCFGFEPSQELKYSVASPIQTSPFHQKTQNDIEELKININKLAEQLDDIKIIHSIEPEKNITTVTDIANIVEKNETLLSKLTEAEDHIEYLEEQMRNMEESTKKRQTYFEWA